MVHWVVNLYEAVVERSKSGRPDKVIFRCKIILILYIFNLGKSVWKAAQKEMKRTANAEKNLQKKWKHGLAGRTLVLQVGFLFCRQDFCFTDRVYVLQAGFFFAGRIFVLQARFLFCGQDFSAKKSRTTVFQAGFSISMVIIS